MIPLELRGAGFQPVINDCQDGCLIGGAGRPLLTHNAAASILRPSLFPPVSGMALATGKLRLPAASAVPLTQLIGIRFWVEIRIQTHGVAPRRK